MIFCGGKATTSGHVEPSRNLFVDSLRSSNFVRHQLSFRPVKCDNLVSGHFLKSAPVKFYIGSVLI